MNKKGEGIRGRRGNYDRGKMKKKMPRKSLREGAGDVYFIFCCLVVKPGPNERDVIAISSIREFK